MAALVLAVIALAVGANAQRGGGAGGGGVPGGRAGAPGRGAGVPPDARTRPNQDQPPTFRSTVTLVQIDALVTDASGNPVTNLTAEDFEIREGGARREITTFAAVNIEPPVPSPASDAEPDVVSNLGPPGRTYLIALDETAPDRALRTRAILRRFIEQYVGPNDLVGVALTGRGLSTSGQDFTNNQRLLLQAIDKFSGGFDESAVSAPVSSNGRQLASSLRSLTEFLATMPGRKVLLYIGEGLGGIDVDAAKDYRGGALTPAEFDAHEAIAAATRGNVTIYPIDPRGLTTDTIAAESFDVANLEARVDLATLADVTGGFSLVSSNNLAAAFQRLVSENGSYYTLGFPSELVRADGRFVPVEVTVRRPGLRVRSRSGYVAPLGRGRAADIDTDARNPVVATALGSAVGRSDVGMRVSAAPYRGGGGNASVALVVELDVSRLGLTEKNGVMSGDLELAYLVTDAKGKVRPGRRHTATVSFKGTAGDKTSRWVRAVSEFELPEGRYQVRVAAGTASRAGSVVYDLEVPDFGDGEIAMSHAVLTSSRAGELQTLRLRGAFDRALPGPPIAAREFSPQDTIAVYVEAYRNGRGTPPGPAVTVDLRTADAATVVRPAAEQKIGVPIHGENGIGVLSAMPLAGLPPGSYVLQLEARADAEHVAIRKIPLRIR